MFRQPMQLLKLLLFLAISCTLLQRTSTTTNKLPLVINTWGFLEANKAAWNAFYQKNAGKDAGLNALIEGCTKCESLQCDGTVGFGGSPDENGETTLDAMIMDGATMNIGAVAGMRQIKDAIKVARHVLENTQHTLLVGEAATNFAVMMGFHRESLSTLKSTKMWLKWVSAKCQPNFWLNVKPDPRGSCGPYKPIMEKIEFDQQQVGERELYSFDRWNHDTIGMIVIDAAARIYAGTSTNGARHKIPGRVGDSPIPGSGAYADNEIGAAVATGDGDVMMRFAPSLLAVEFLRNGKTPQQAAQNAMQRIVRFYPKFSGGLVVADRFGNYSAACVGMEQFPYSVVFGDKSQKSQVEHVKCNVVENEQQHNELK